MRSSVLLLLTLCLLSFLVSARAQGEHNPPEPPEPPAISAVQALLEQAAQIKQPEMALRMAEEAEALARQQSDAAGAARAHRHRARLLEALKRTEEARAAWGQAAEAWGQVGDGPGQMEAWLEQALLMDEAQRGTLVTRAVGQAQKEARRPLAAARVLHTGGERYYEVADLSHARLLFEAGLAIRQAKVPDSLAVADSLNSLGEIASDQRDLAKARGYHHQALEIRQKQAPGSLEVATSLDYLGNVAFAQGDLGKAREAFEAALEIHKKLEPGSLGVAASLETLGVVVFAQGDLEAARNFHQQALEIRQEQSPGSLDVAWSLTALGMVAQYRGDLEKAKESYEQALEIRRLLAPGSFDVARSLDNLGSILAAMGNLGEARKSREEALAIRQKEAPGSLEVATSLQLLGELARRLEKPAEARKFYQDALEIRKKQAPGSLDVAESLEGLGIVAVAQKEFGNAWEIHQEALEIRKQQAPGSFFVAWSLESLGQVARAMGDLAKARKLYQEALLIHQGTAPGSFQEAVSLGLCADVAYSQQDLPEAVAQAAQAWEIIRKQSVAMGGDEEGRQAFSRRFVAYSTRLARYQVKAGQPEAALLTLEQGRAKALEQLLGERDLLARQADPVIWRAYSLAERRRGQAGDRLAALASAETSAKEDAQRNYTRARLEAEAGWEAVKRSVGKLLVPPEDPALARRALAPGTLALAFAVDEKETLLILAGGSARTPTRAFVLPIGREELERQVARLHQKLLLAHDPEPIRRRRAAVETLVVVRQLTAALFPTAALREIAQAQRLVLAPDGPLWHLPFAALPLDAPAPNVTPKTTGKQTAVRTLPNGAGAVRYLGLEKPLTYAPSLTLYARTLRRTATAPSGKIAALVIGNPRFQTSPATVVARPAGQQPGAKPAIAAKRKEEGERGLLSNDGTAPPQLPGTEAQAKAIAALYRATPHLGSTPTEAFYRQHAGKAQVIHLATHGHWNRYRAMSSGLRLAVPEPESALEDTDRDGALQAWEMFSLPLQAELVVLSACESGLGEKVPGEGLVGFTWALQAAGARSLVASQWQVEDRSTQELMVALHQGLRRGLAKDEALRQAMRKLAQGKDWPHPYHWSGFLLLGDPRNNGLSARN